MSHSNTRCIGSWFRSLTATLKAKPAHKKRDAIRMKIDRVIDHLGGPSAYTDLLLRRDFDVIQQTMEQYGLTRREINEYSAQNDGR